LRESLSPFGTDGQNATDATSVDDDTIIVEQPRIISPTMSKLRSTRIKKLAPLEQIKLGEPILVGESTTASHPVIQDDNSSVLSDLKSEMFDDEDGDSIMTTVPEHPKSKRSTVPARRNKKIPRPTTDLDHAPPVREPGDYVLTARLLTGSTDAWIRCKNCEEAFVQQDSYFTRSSCPRCERHSKLYGYRWPKTDKEGRNDTEERVLDHRTVHRFVDPTEEKVIRRRNRSVTESRVATREVSEVAVEEEEVAVPRAKKRRTYSKKNRLTM
jgi:histone-lysine N-methyltransferase SUV420H